jgi:hypothetical protein
MLPAQPGDFKEFVPGCPEECKAVVQQSGPEKGTLR